MSEIPLGNIYVSSKKWIDGDVLTWNSFNNYDWEGFSKEEYNSFSDNYIFVPDTTNIKRINVVFTDSSNYTIEKEMFMGGSPITYYQNPNTGDSVLPVIIDTNFNYSSKHNLVFNGIPIQLGEKENKFCLFFNNTGRSKSKYDNGFYLEGTPLSTNMYNDIILKKINGKVQNEQEIFIGDIPIIIRQINNKWFIVITL